MICGNTYHNHLYDWWERKLVKKNKGGNESRYQPYETYLNQSYKLGTIPLLSTSKNDTTKTKKNAKYEKQKRILYRNLRQDVTPKNCDCSNQPPKYNSCYDDRSIEEFSFFSLYKDSVDSKKAQGIKTTSPVLRRFANAASLIIGFELFELKMLQNVDNYRLKRRKKKD